eukprot:scaffold1000_cov166-Amphora_coffeaeformis.AAC.18
MEKALCNNTTPLQIISTVVNDFRAIKIWYDPGFKFRHLTVSVRGFHRLIADLLSRDVLPIYGTILDLSSTCGHVRWRSRRSSQ